MQSLARKHFPRIVFRHRDKRLWNPLTRKPLKNRPEERVRLRLIESLLEDTGWSKHRISTELPVEFEREEAPIRADILCYSRDFKPRLLIECKAENVALSEKTAEQIARYNTVVKAPYLMMSNGIEDRWYGLDGNNEVTQLHKLPGILDWREPQNERSYSYWVERGFAGNAATPALRHWMGQAIPAFWKEQKNHARFLSFNQSPDELYPDHYYRIFPFPRTGHPVPDKVAVTFTATPFGATHLLGIINRDDANAGIVAVNLDLLAEGESPNTSLYHAGGRQTADATVPLRLNLAEYEPHQLQELPRRISDWFNDFGKG